MQEASIVKKIFYMIEHRGTMRQKYLLRFFFRLFVLILAFVLYFFDADGFQIIEPHQFLKRFSVFHLLWFVWVVDMLFKIFPLKGMFALGATKQSSTYFCAASQKTTKEQLLAYTKRQNRRALLVFLVWTCLGVAIALLYKIRLFGRRELLLISIIFYVCDLICVLFWCPFRVFFIQNRCCTTCRIFNWDHLMMTTPLICINSFFSWSLVIASVGIFLLWEYRVHHFPERFYEGTNGALQCRNCTDLLCGRRRS